MKFRASDPGAAESVPPNEPGDNRRGTREARPVIRDFQRQALRQHRRDADASGTVPRPLRQRRHSNRTSTSDGSDLGRIYRIRLDTDSGESMDQVLAAYRSRPDVEYAEPNPIISLCAAPNDWQYTNQWALQKVRAPDAWDTCRGSSEVVVAVIDTGVDCGHPDLQSNLWTNTTEQNGRPGFDDDNNGYLDDIHGYNFMYHNSDANDEHGHGTHCAGIIAAVGNNRTDIAGVCWSARIMPLKVFGTDGDGTVADAIPAIYYAVANGADVISCSWGGPKISNALRDAVAYAQAQGVVIVAAAGNTSSSMPFYPAALPDVISVAATDASDNRQSLSNYGDWVDIAAPGNNIVSLCALLPGQITRAQTVATMSGTSMAGAYVAGSCALLLAANPLLRCDELHALLTSTADRIPSGICSSNGRLNLYAALRAAIPTAGTIRMDRESYGAGAEIHLLVADWNLRWAGSRTVSVEGAGGDKETVTLRETVTALGVFTGSIVNQNALPRSGDSVLEARDGESITARYLDADDGTGRINTWRQATASADYTPAGVLPPKTTPSGATMTVEFQTTEPARAEVRYGKTAGGPFTLTATDTALGTQHRVSLHSLIPQTLYYFVVAITDEAGNAAIANSGGKGYSFIAQNTAGQFRVPSLYPTIQAALDAAWDGDTIWVANGTYSGPGFVDVDFHGKSVTLRSENGPGSCTIDGRGQSGAFYIHCGETAATVLDGFTIANCDEATGAAIQCMGSSPTIRNCVFFRNSADYYGGALCNSYNSHPTVTLCTFQGNSCAWSSTDGRGGAIANRYGSCPTLTDCTFLDNSSPGVGGAIDNFNACQPHIHRCIFLGNSAADGGGAVASGTGCRPVFSQCTFTENRTSRDGGALLHTAGSAATVENCIFNGNVANGSGGAVKNEGAVAVLVNCTISGNQAYYRCGGVWNELNSNVELDSCILWGNTDGTGSASSERAQLGATAGQLDGAYCCIQGLGSTPDESGNFGLDPQFVDAANDDFHLKSKGWRWDGLRDTWTRDSVTSPCIDTGNPRLPLGDEPILAPDGSNKFTIVNYRIDIGAYGGTGEASIAPLK